MHAEHMTFDEACTLLERQMGAVPANAAAFQTMPATPEQKTRTWDYEEGARIAFEAHNRLMQNAGGEANEYIEYLDRRNLDPGTWVQFGLGMRPTYNPDAQAVIPAITIPWYLPDGRITAIRVRYLNPPNPKNKIRSAPASIIVGNLFNYGVVLNRIDASPATLKNAILFVVEGEINGMSIAQSTRNIADVDMVSFGAQDHIFTEEQIANMAKYSTVIVWTDLPTIAHKKATILGTPHYIASQATDVLPRGSKKKDANDYLAPERLESETEWEWGERTELGRCIADALIAVAGKQSLSAKRDMYDRLLVAATKPNTDLSITKMAAWLRMTRP